MSAPKPQIFDPVRKPEPKYFTRIPDDALEDPRLSTGNIGVFAQLLKRHWTDDPVLKITQAELAKRCRMTIRAILPHLVKLEKLGYIARDRDYDNGGGPNQITLTYELRPTLELTPNLPVARSSNDACDRKKTSDCNRKKTSDLNDACDRKKTSDCNRKKTSDPSFLRELIQRELSSSNAPLPVETNPLGSPENLPESSPEPPRSSPEPPRSSPEPPRSSPEPPLAVTPSNLPPAPTASSAGIVGNPEYPEANGMFMIMPGEHKHPEIEAREIWGDIWRAWRSPQLCYRFYEHQEWYTLTAWKHAVKTCLTRGITPNSIGYLEKIAVDADINGINSTPPVQRGAIGPVPYKSGAMRYGCFPGP